PRGHRCGQTFRDTCIQIFQKKKKILPGVVANAFNPSTREAEACRFLIVLVQPVLYNNF
ncbi:mCG1048509, partial [Mus musculus]